MSAATRAAAARVLTQTVAEGVSLRASLPRELTQLAAEEHGLLRQLCYGTLRSYHRLQAIISARLRKPLKDRDADIQALLLSGLYQILEMRTPNHAAIATTVEACRKLKKPWATGLVNGVLRNCIRERDSLYEGLSDAEVSSHPEWLYQMIQAAWPDQADELIAASNSQPPMYLRVNQLQSSREDYLLKLQERAIEAQAGRLSPVSIRLSKAVDVGALPDFFKGYASVQDESAQLAALLLDAQPGERVLDACCAPGGKACHILELQPEIAELVAWDIDGQRLVQVQENLERLRLSAKLDRVDALQPTAGPDTVLYDRILVDAPCSGSGVIRRHPDIKVLRRATDISPMADTQRAILGSLWSLLKPGGLLLYVTCSILPAENDAVIEQFLDQTQSANSESITEAWGEACKFGRQILPGLEDLDGLYFCRLRKAL